ncbi:MAG: BrnT family toxin [Steroidobacteraceae bacterium]
MASLFDWDPAKDVENQRKHGVSFSEAQRAFLDPYRLIARDRDHSRSESRYYCFGRVAGHVITVRFTQRDGRVRIFGAGYWRKGRKIYGQVQRVF